MSNDGGPAFSRSANQWAEDGGAIGMTLRDYLAAQALPIAAMNAFANALPGGSKTVAEADVARDCYALADAMLAERAK